MICETPTNHDILRQPSSIIVLSFDHRVVFYNEYLRKRSDLPFSRKGDRKKEKNVGSFTHEQNIICTQRKLDDITREQTIIGIKIRIRSETIATPMMINQVTLLLVGMLWQSYPSERRQLGTQFNHAYIIC